MKTTAVKTLSGFTPCDKELWDLIPMGSTVGIEYSKKRNYENHKRFFAFIDQIFDMQDHFNNKDILRKYLTMKAGYFTQIVTPENNVLFIADSISFEKLDETEFKTLFSKCIDVFIDKFAKDCTNEELMQIIGFG